VLNDRIAAAQSIAAPLRELEQLMDATLAKAAELTMAMTAAPAGARVSRTVGQPAFAALGTTVAAITAARGSLVDTHHRLAEVADELRVPARAYGDESEKIPWSAETSLREVA
jgi:hypothetical protein